MDKFKAIYSRKTHEGKALECFGFSEKEDGGVTLMRWNQTPYLDCAKPPELFEISGDEWRALREAFSPTLPTPPKEG